MRKLSACLAALLLTSCGGGGGDPGRADPVVVTPPPPPTCGTPTPPPTPTPTPSPPPTANVTFVDYFGVKTSAPVLAGDGNLYFTSPAGSRQCRQSDPQPCGSILRRTSAGAVSVVHNFGETSADGYFPGGMIVGHDGALYGLTSDGPHHGGTIFRLSLDGPLRVLHQFGADPRGGYGPNSLVAASDGNFYGTTSQGGAHDCPQIPSSAPSCGTLFRLTPGGTLTLLSSFGASPTDGVQPAGLMQASDGHLYGVTTMGGANGCGTLFRVTLAGVRTERRSFCQSLADASSPQFAPVQASDGALYGVTPSGGAGRCGWSFGCGTVYRMTLSGSFSIVHAFAADDRRDGYGPNSLVEGRDGFLYGTTTSGGVSQMDGTGTIFRLGKGGGKTILYSFPTMGFAVPGRPGAMTQAADDSFWGTTEYGSNGHGTLFRMTLQ